MILQWFYGRMVWLGEKLLRSGLAGLHGDEKAKAEFIERQAQIATDRLNKRYDFAAAMNETANRTIEAKRQAEQSGQGLSGNQLKALEFQRRYLERLTQGNHSGVAS